MTTPEPDFTPLPEHFINRELSWLAFARRVLELAEDRSLPLLERVKFAGIMGMLYDEFTMKRIGGLLKQLEKANGEKLSADGLTPIGELNACRAELHRQNGLLDRLVLENLRPALAEAGLPILDHDQLDPGQREHVARYFQASVEPVLTPLAVDATHPFPFIANLGLNLVVRLGNGRGKRGRYVCIEVPGGRPRLLPLPGESGFVPLEQVIGANLDRLFPGEEGLSWHLFRVTRGAKDDPWDLAPAQELEPDLSPGRLLALVTAELKARKFAGVVRLEVDRGMPEALQGWLAERLGVDGADLFGVAGLLGVADLMKFPAAGHPELRLKPHRPVTHPRLRGAPGERAEAFFAEIRRGDLLLHHPYHDFDTSVLRFLQWAAVDPRVVALKLTIYRTSSRSPIIQALIEAARRGKAVAVLVEITARFDEAPNILWARRLEQEGVHVVYGVERLKTHVKLALVVREEEGGVRRYVHVSTGNYHTGTARLYEDLGILSADPQLAGDAAALFNVLTGGAPAVGYGKLMVAPHDLRERFIALIQREVGHARAGRPCGIWAKMNQLQDMTMIGELYRAGLAGVPITLNVRGLCCLRAGVPGLSENIRVYGTLGQFLEHGRIYRFENGGDPEFYTGSADWMRRNLDRRMETIMPVTDPAVRAELEAIRAVYEADNATAWDMRPDGTYQRRRPAPGEEPRPAQEAFIARIAGG